MKVAGSPRCDSSAAPAVFMSAWAEEVPAVQRPRFLGGIGPALAAHDLADPIGVGAQFVNDVGEAVAAKPQQVGGHRLCLAKGLVPHLDFVQTHTRQRVLRNGRGDISFMAVAVSGQGRIWPGSARWCVYRRAPSRPGPGCGANRSALRSGSLGIIPPNHEFCQYVAVRRVGAPTPCAIINIWIPAPAGPAGRPGVRGRRLTGEGDPALRPPFRNIGTVRCPSHRFAAVRIPRSGAATSDRGRRRAGERPLTSCWTSGAAARRARFSAAT